MRFSLLTVLLFLTFAACTGDTDPVTDNPGNSVDFPIEEAPLTLDPYTFEDSVALRSHGPYFTYRLNTVRAEGGSQELRRLINDTLSARLFGFVVSDNLPLDTAVKAYVNPLFADYTSQDVQEEWLQEAPQALSRQQEERTEVVYRGDSLIVFGHQYYEYTGGAHGMSFTTLLPFRVDPPQFLTYDDFFAAGTEDALSRLLTAKAMEHPDRVFGDSIPVTRNVAPLPDGMRFLYDPYAIGPYSSGEIALDLPYAVLEGILRPGVADLARSW
ncbi:uncharacterized protein DUF3298 [Neolewinella xylanilytica]|uniref:Uncharacterized protein DUF3298 n=1 Tax=Neolewinella xylanilytica TaxID=1514080 RepID=A0A2S6I9J5_9BACT|nr:DUF3298 and DUF4163 domain-containing protein [Neolewinella xylanilytica]PPK88170.1 uncharacterized protein DUF3298 [Neolewinella xylanilytica]